MHRHRTSCFKSHPRRLGNVQLIHYPRGLQPNKRWEWESNLCLSASIGSQVQLTTPWLTALMCNKVKFVYQDHTGDKKKVVFISRSFVCMIRIVCFFFSEKGGLRVQVVFINSGHIIQNSLYIERDDTL